jgi:hypothetical protein
MLRANSRAARGLTTATGKPSCSSRLASSVFQTSGGLDDDQAHAALTQLSQQGLEPSRVVAGTLAGSGSMHAPFEACLGHVNADVVHGSRIGCGLTSSVRHIPSLQDAKCVRVTVRAWQRTPVHARPTAQGRARGSRGRRAVHALAKPLLQMPNRQAARWICGRCGYRRTARLAVDNGCAVAHRASLRPQAPPRSTTMTQHEIPSRRNIQGEAAKPQRGWFISTPSTGTAGLFASRAARCARSRPGTRRSGPP